MTTVAKTTDDIYTMIDDWKHGTIDRGYVVKLMLQLVQLVQFHVNKPGRTKRLVVMSVLKRVIREKIKHTEDRRLLITFVDTVCPALIDSAVTLGRSNMKGWCAKLSKKVRSVCSCS